MLRKLQPEDDPLQETGSSGESEADRAERQQRQEKRLNDLLDDKKSGQKDLYFTGLDGERFFAPRLYFRNLAESGETETWLKIYLDPSCDDSVVVCLSSKCTGTFQEQFELEHFPFDEQDLTMEMASEHAREDGSCSVQLERNDNDMYRRPLS